MNHRTHIPARQIHGAFTLVELLAAMGVLTLLLLVVVQMINSVSAVTAGTSHHLDADSQARFAFDRMAVDFSQMVKRTDSDYFFVKKSKSGNIPGNDQMAFYSESSGYYPIGITNATQKSNASLVGYCISNFTSQTPQLQRLNKALVWNGVTLSDSNDHPMTFLPQTLPGIWPGVFGNATSDMSVSTDRDYQVIGESIFRMEICYLMPLTAANGGTSTSTVLSDTPYLVPGATPKPVGVPNPAATPYNGMRDVAAVVVTLAVLDSSSRLLIPKANQVDVLNAIAGKLDDVPTNPNTSGTPVTLASTPAKLWQAHVDNGDLIAAGLTRRAASQVHIYERYFPLGNSQ